jgi:hypothetical protein
VSTVVASSWEENATTIWVSQWKNYEWIRRFTLNFLLLLSHGKPTIPFVRAFQEEGLGRSLILEYRHFVRHKSSSSHPSMYILLGAIGRHPSQSQAWCWHRRWSKSYTNKGLGRPGHHGPKNAARRLLFHGEERRGLQANHQRITNVLTWRRTG